MREAVPTDPRQLRALAHPLRLRMLGELRVSGPLTVGRLGEALDEAPGNVSYHLGVLAEFGFVVEEPGLAADRRERWWRAAHATTHIDETDAATVPLRHQVVEVYAAALHRSIDSGDTAGMSGDTVAVLDEAQLAEAAGELQAVLAKWAGVRGGKGAVPVQLIAHAFRRA